MKIKEKLFYLMPVLNTAFTEGKWNFPIIKKVKEFYQKHGLLLTIGWIVFISHDEITMLTPPVLAARLK